MLFLMKKWIFLSIIVAILGSASNISLKEGLFTTYSDDFTAYMSLFSLVMISIFNFVIKGNFNLNYWGMSTGFFLGIANIFLIKASQKAPNPGIAMALMRCQAIYTFIASYLIFGGKFKPYKLIGMLITIVGVYLIVSNQIDKKEIKGNKSKKDKNEKSNNLNWIYFALLSGVFMTVKDILTKKALNVKNSTTLNILFNALVFQTILTFIYKYFNTKNLKLEDVNKDGKTDKKDYKYVIITSVFFILYILTIMQATKLAPNIGYIKSIDTFGVILTVIISKYLFKSDINKGSWIGIITTLIGLVLVSV